MDCICASVSAEVILMAQSQNFRKTIFASSFPVYNQASLKPAYILCTLYQGTHAAWNALKSPFSNVDQIVLLLGTPPAYPVPQSGLFFVFASWQALSCAIIYSIRFLHSRLPVAA